MSNTAWAFPAGPGESDEDVFPLRLRLRLRDNFGFVLQQLRARDPAFRPLAKGPWSVFIAIAAHFQMNAEAWPGQEAIASFSGCSTRAARYHIAELESGGFLTLRRERRGDGGDRIFYRPGPLMLRGLAAFDTGYPKDRAKVLMPVRAVVLPTQSVTPTQTHRPANVAGTPAETVAMEPRDQNEIKPSSCCQGAPAKLAAATLDEEEPVVSKEDREIARWALAERMKRKHPKRPPPRWFDRSDIEMVARCTATIEGDRAAKEQAQREAITGAFCASKDGPPTARFIWERLEHFLEHVERGQKKLRNDAALDAQRRQREREENEGHLRRNGMKASWERTGCSPPTRKDLSKMRAEFEEIAAEAAPPYRKVLMGLVEQYRALEAKARERWRSPHDFST
jgi:hypothetical protein